MFRASIQLYRNAYKGLSPPMWWLALVMLVNRSGTMVIPFLTVYLTSQGYTLTDAGLVMTTFGLGAILGGYLGGRLSDRYGYFYIQFFSLLLNGLLFFLLSFMETLWQIGACVFVLSVVGEAFRPANAAAIAAYSNEENRIRCYSLNRLAVNLGWAIGPALGGLLASIDYHLLFWVDGFTCIGAAALLHRSLFAEKDRKEEPKGGEEGIAAVSAWRDGVFLRGMLFTLMTAVCFFQLFSLTPVYYKNEVGLSESAIGSILGMNGLIIACVEMVLVYKLEQRRNPVVYIVLGALLIGFAYALLNLAPILAVVVLSMLIITLGEMLLFPFLNSFWVGRSNAASRGQYAALYTMTFAAAHMLAPTLAARVADNWGFSTLWVADLGICILAALGFFTLKKHFIRHD